MKEDNARPWQRSCDINNRYIITNNLWSYISNYYSNCDISIKDRTNVGFTQNIMKMKIL